MYTNVYGLVVNGKALEFKEQKEKSKPDITEMKSDWIFPVGYMIARYKKEGKGGGGFALLVRQNLQLREILVDGPLV